MLIEPELLFEVRELSRALSVHDLSGGHATGWPKELTLSV